MTEAEITAKESSLIGMVFVGSAKQGTPFSKTRRTERRTPCLRWSASASLLRMISMEPSEAAKEVIAGEDRERGF